MLQFRSTGWRSVAGAGALAAGLIATTTAPMANAQSGGPFAPATTRVGQSVDVSRLLIQASYGATQTEIDAATALGVSGWLDRQFQTASMDTHWDYVVVRKGPIGCTVCNAQYINATMESFWTQAVRGPDQLRQRMVLALSELFVVSTVNSAVEIQEDAHAAYLDMLSRNAFGNFRTLLQEVSAHPTMATYLSFMQNEKEDPVTGRIPDENYAREVMQLFTIGLWQLNPDGTRRKDSNGQDIPAFTQADVMGLAKVFTGWSWAGAATTDDYWHGWAGNAGGASWNKPLMLYPQFHSTSEKRFLGAVVPAGTGGTQSMRVALDRLFNHPNAGPFLGSRLIKRFVTSNPSPAYVGRVAAAFADNGAGIRGDLKAVLRAVLTDAEARGTAFAQQPTYGKLREPLVRFGQWMRAFDAKASNGYYSIWNLEDPVSSIGQNPLRAPSVFNWFRPDYAPPGSIAQLGLVAPEFQITHETTVTGWINFVTNVVDRGFGWGDSQINGNYAAEIALAGSPDLLVARLSKLLLAGQMSKSTRTTILAAVNAIPASDARKRAITAIALVMVSPDFIVQK